MQKLDKQNNNTIKRINKAKYSGKTNEKNRDDTNSSRKKILKAYDPACREYYRQINANKFENLGEISKIMV